MTYHKSNIRKNKNTKGKKTQSKRKTKSQKSIRKKSLRREKKIGGYIIEPAHIVVQSCVDNASKSFFNDGKSINNIPKWINTLMGFLDKVNTCSVYKSCSRTMEANVCQEEKTYEYMKASGLANEVYDFFFYIQELIKEQAEEDKQAEEDNLKKNIIYQYHFKTYDIKELPNLFKNINIDRIKTIKDNLEEKAEDHMNKMKRSNNEVFFPILYLQISSEYLNYIETFYRLKKTPSDYLISPPTHETILEGYDKMILNVYERSIKNNETIDNLTRLPKVNRKKYIKYYLDAVKKYSQNNSSQITTYIINHIERAIEEA